MGSRITSQCLLGAPPTLPAEPAHAHGMDIAARLAAIGDVPTVAEIDDILREFAATEPSPQDAELIDALLEIRSLASAGARGTAP